MCFIPLLDCLLDQFWSAWLCHFFCLSSWTDHAFFYSIYLKRMEKKLQILRIDSYHNLLRSHNKIKIYFSCPLEDLCAYNLCDMYKWNNHSNLQKRCDLITKLHPNLCIIDKIWTFHCLYITTKHDTNVNFRIGMG